MPLLTAYATNDVLRLSKEDLVKLCGTADGIRLYNLAHNIQIKPKLSIFVTFRERSFFSAIFLAEWKAEFLVRKIIAAYLSSSSNRIKSSSTATKEIEDREVNSDDQTHQHQSKEDENEEKSRLVNSLNEYELFLRVRGVLVKTSDEVLNNLQDQSKFMVTFEHESNGHASKLNTPPPSNELNNLVDGCASRCSGKAAANLVKIVMIPLE